MNFNIKIMRKFAAAIALLTCSMLSNMANAQKTVPRYGTAPNQNQTMGGLTIGQKIIADVAATPLDTIVLLPSAFITNYQLTVNDSVAIHFNYRNSFLNDVINLSINNTAGSNHIVRFTSYRAFASNTQFSSAGASIALTASKRAFISLRFDGTAWVEQFRMVQ